MAAISPPAYQQAGSYSARVDRLSAISAMLQYPGTSSRTASPISINDGVKPSFQNSRLKVSAQATPNMSIQLTSGWAYVQNDDIAAYGAYVVVNDGTITIPIGASSGSQYRIDTVVAKVLDAETLGTNNTATFEVVSGAYAASRATATRGTIPPNAAILADVYVDAGVSSITNSLIADARTYTVASGGIQPVTSTTDLDNGAPGQVRYQMDTDTFVYTNLTGATRPLLDSAGATLGRQFARVAVGAEQSVTNSTTLVDATGFSFPVVSGGVYVVRGLLGGTGSTTGDLKIGWVAPGASTFDWAPGMQPATAAATVGSVITDRSTIAQSQILGTISTSSVMTARIDGLLVAAASGTFKLQIAQGTADATASTLKSGSYLIVERVA